MKRIRLAVGLLLAGIFLSAVSNAQSEPFLYQSIFNADSSINFMIGFFHTKSEYITRDDGTGYTKMRMAVINKENARPFRWDDYKVYLLLKNGDLFYNYTTKAAEGELACKWTVQPAQNHIQSLCFDKAFEVNQIERVWLSMSDNRFFELIQTNK